MLCECKYKLIGKIRSNLQGAYGTHCCCCKESKLLTEMVKEDDFQSNRMICNECLNNGPDDENDNQLKRSINDSSKSKQNKRNCTPEVHTPKLIRDPLEDMQWDIEPAENQKETSLTYAQILKRLMIDPSQYKTFT